MEWEIDPGFYFQSTTSQQDDASENNGLKIRSRVLLLIYKVINLKIMQWESDPGFVYNGTVSQCVWKSGNHEKMRLSIISFNH